MLAPSPILLTDDHRRRALKSLRDKALIGDGCWEWAGAHHSAGYASLQVRGRTCYGHRLMYELLVGPIPEGLHLDHLCRNRGCIRPAAAQARQTHCKWGHPFDEANTFRRANGGRGCRKCQAESSRRYADRKRRGLVKAGTDLAGNGFTDSGAT